ncbi:MAG: hypothetical protein L0Z62_17845, partial [Gemmataceae bacterium]|nr:hypothetical protein [Gemmataceae bacterium]
ASGSWDQTVKVWDARSGQELLTLKGHTDGVWCVAFSPDGQRLASGSWDSTISSTGGAVKIWDARSGQELLTLKAHTSDVRSVAFSPDSQRLTGGSSDRTVMVWDVRRGSGTFVLKGHTGWVESVAFSPNGQRVIAASGAMVKSWDAATGTLIQPPADPSPPEGQRLARSPDGKMTAWANSSDVQMLHLEHWQRSLQIDAEIGLEWHLRQAIETAKARQWFAAAFHRDRLIQSEPQIAEHHNGLGRARAEQGRWSDAAKAFARASELEPKHLGHRQRQAWALLADGDVAGYGQVCTQLLRDFGNQSDASTAASLVATAALSDRSGVAPRRLVELAERAVQSGPKSWSYRQTLGAARYLAGDFRAAVDTLTQAVASRNQLPSAWMELFLALAERRRGNILAAAGWLKANDRPRWPLRVAGMLSTTDPLAAATWLALPAAELPAPGSLSWEDRLIQRQLRREAEAALHGQPAAKRD